MKFLIRTRMHYGKDRKVEFTTEPQLIGQVTRYRTDSLEEIKTMRQATQAIKDCLAEEGIRLYFYPEKFIDKDPVQRYLDDVKYYTPPAVVNAVKGGEIDLLKGERVVEGESLNKVLQNPPFERVGYVPPTEKQFAAIKARLNAAENMARSYKKQLDEVKRKFYTGVE